MTPLTIDDVHRNAQAAIEAGDLHALHLALEDRRSAIAVLTSAPPSQEMATRIVSAIQAGEALNRGLSTLKIRLRTDAARLAMLHTGFATGLSTAPKNHIDCRG